MTVKQFFTSQAVKCIIVLLIIALVADGVVASPPYMRFFSLKVIAKTVFVKCFC